MSQLTLPLPATTIFTVISSEIVSSGCLSSPFYDNVDVSHDNVDPVSQSRPAPMHVSVYPAVLCDRGVLSYGKKGCSRLLFRFFSQHSVLLILLLSCSSASSYWSSVFSHSNMHPTMPCSGSLTIFITISNPSFCYDDTLHPCKTYIYGLHDGQGSNRKSAESADCGSGDSAQQQIFTHLQEKSKYQDEPHSERSSASSALSSHRARSTSLLDLSMSPSVPPQVCTTQ